MTALLITTTKNFKYFPLHFNLTQLNLNYNHPLKSCSRIRHIGNVKKPAKTQRIYLDQTRKAVLGDIFKRYNIYPIL